MEQQQNNGWPPSQQPNSGRTDAQQQQAHMAQMHMMMAQQQQQQQHQMDQCYQQMMTMMPPPPGMMCGAYGQQIHYAGGAQMEQTEPKASSRPAKDPRTSLEKKRLRNRVNQAKLRVREKNQNTNDRKELIALRNCVASLDRQLEEMKQKMLKYESVTTEPPPRSAGARPSSPTGSAVGSLTGSDQGSRGKSSDSGSVGKSSDQGSTGKSDSSGSFEKSSDQSCTKSVGDTTSASTGSSNYK